MILNATDSDWSLYSEGHVQVMILTPEMKTHGFDISTEHDSNLSDQRLMQFRFN